LDLVAKICKGLADLVTVAKFATTIHADIFVGARGRVVRQPLVEPIDWGSFGSKSPTKDTATEMVGEQDIACLAVEPDQVVELRGGFAFLDHKGEVDG
jgi:hypothetical protein